MDNQSQRYSVKQVGKRLVGSPRCAMCGHVPKKSETVCPSGCFWNLMGWTGYRGTDGVVVFKDARGLKVAEWGHGWNPVTKTRTAKSWPKIVAAARELGWSGDTAQPSQPTFVDMEAL